MNLAPPKIIKQLLYSLIGFVFVVLALTSSAQAESFLWDSVSNNDIGRAKTLIARGADVNQKNSYGNPIILHAVSIGNAELVELLISKGADVNAKGQFDRVALHFANKKGMAKILLAHGATVEPPTNFGETPLHWAAHGINSMGKQVDLVEFAETLIKHGANVNKRAGQGRSYRTPLSYAAESNNLAVAKLLISYGADVDDGGGGVSPLSAAGANGDFVEMAQLLVENGAKLDSPSPPLIFSAGRGNIKVTNYLLAQGANPNAADKNGVTALYSAAGSDYSLSAAEALLRNGANPNVKNMHGRTALHQAASQGAVKVMELLLANRADVNAATNDGYTPLHGAVSYGNNVARRSAVEVLIKSGANVNARTSRDGETPFHKAISRGDIEIVKLLLDYGADVNAVSKFGVTSLYFARNSEAITKLLKERGAK